MGTIILHLKGINFFLHSVKKPGSMSTIHLSVMKLK